MTEQEKIKVLAEKVMGWGVYMEEYDCGMCTFIKGFILKEGEGYTNSEWNPFTNIEDAWGLMEKILTTNGLLDVSYERDLYHWRVAIEGVEETNEDFKEAICGACIKWLEYKKEKTK